MKPDRDDYIKYRLERAHDTLDDARILAEKGKRNSAINRLYYSAYYAVTALLLKKGLKPVTHTGTKSGFTENFIKNGLIDKKFGKLYSQLFTFRQKGDYDDLFDFDEQQVMPYFEPLREFIALIETQIKEESV